MGRRPGTRGWGDGAREGVGAARRGRRTACGGAEAGSAGPGRGETVARGGRGLPAPPAAGPALPFGPSGVWEEAEPGAGQPSGELGGTAASQKTGTGGRKQVGKEGAGRELGRGRVAGRRTRPHSLGAAPLGMEGEEWGARGLQCAR